MKNLRLGEILMEAGTIDRQQLEAALAYQQSHRDLPIGQALVALGFATQAQVTGALARRLGLAVVDPDRLIAQARALETVPRSLAARYSLLPLRRRGDRLTVATSDPLNYEALEELHQRTGLELDLLLAEPEPLRRAIQYYYSDMDARRTARDAGSRLPGPAAPGPHDAAREEAGGPAVQLLNDLLQRAVAAGASDIHIEPYEAVTRVRMRLDGAMTDHMPLPPALHQPLIARIKVLAGLDIAERRLPQDGHFRARAGAGGEVNLRVSVMPTLYGEKAVLRLLDGGADIDHADHFGMNDRVYRRFLPLLDRPHGILYLTGPTGSGKTTTLYLVLEALRRRAVNIVTIEDPVERSIEGISQTQVNPAAGLTFERGLRALLRQDPDVIMVGETRDAETAEIAVRAAITGHLVFSTLHTNDAAGSVVRLIDMGVAPYLVAGSVTGLLAQRLVRKVCPRCGRPVPVTPAEAALLGPGVRTVCRGAGCPHCHRTGYRGRIAVHELLVPDQALRRMIVQGATAEELTACARRTQGMRTLLEEGRDLVAQGLTTPEELLKLACEG